MSPALSRGHFIGIALMQSPSENRYQVRQAGGLSDIAAALQLRSQVFRGKSGDSDADMFDSVCTHILIEEAKSGTLVCCFRLLRLQDGREIGQSYAAQFYDLSQLAGYAGSMVEMGRFCIRPGLSDPDILRVAWGAMTDFVDYEGVDLLFGCSSFQGTDAGAYLDAFALLKDRHIAPKRWLPRVKAPKVFPFVARLRRKVDIKKARLAMPPLLKSYLMMGGWVSDHAVVDEDMGTLHVFTGLEIGRVPAGRARVLRASGRPKLHPS